MSEYKKVRCPICKLETCGWDAYAIYNPVTDATELGGEYDAGWCNECGDIEPEFYTPEGEELAQLLSDIEAHKKSEAVKLFAPDLLVALKQLRKSVNEIQGYWTESIDNNMRLADEIITRATQP